jgi:hypothetical protein
VMCFGSDCHHWQCRLDMCAHLCVFVFMFESRHLHPLSTFSTIVSKSYINILIPDSNLQLNLT